MKKITMTIMTALMLLTIIPTQSEARSKSNHSSPAGNPVKPNVLASRLNEIKSVDKSTLTISEKKELKKELRSIKSELKTTGGGGIYLSAGAIIIIILLLIILL
jgi:hypothetical protein